MTRLTAALVIAALCSCSLMRTKGPKVKLVASSDIVAVECTTSRTPIIIDALLAVVMLTGTVVAASVAVADGSKKEGAVAGGFGLGTLIFAASGAVGFGRTSACRVAKRGEAAVRARIAP